VVHDAQYTLEEYPARAGWGHSAAQHAVDLARAAGARRLALFHHDPLRDDAALDRLVEDCRRRAGDGLEVFAAAEGPALELPERPGARRADAAPRSAFLDDAGGPAEQTVLVVTDEPGLARRLALFLRPEGLRLLAAGGLGGPAGGAPILGLARAARPDLVVLDARAGRRGALDLCRALRAEADQSLRRAPVVVLVARSHADEEAAEVLAAGATDFLPEPVSPALVRSLVRRWLLRAQASPPPA
jgi:CheY-like chemotaxis protein